MAKQKRITTDMRRDELLAEGQNLEAELEEAQKAIADLTKEVESLKAMLEQIEKSREKGAIPGQACEACPVEEAEDKLRPSARMAIRNLRQFGATGGLPYLRAAERLIRAEIVRLTW